MPAKRHAHEFSALWAHFGPYGPQNIHYHVCLRGDGCDRVLIGPGRACAGSGTDHHRATLGVDVERVAKKFQTGGRRWRINGRKAHGTTSFWAVGDKSPGTIQRIQARPAVGWEIVTYEEGEGVEIRGASYGECLELLADVAAEAALAQDLLESYAEAHEVRWRGRGTRFRRERLAVRGE